MKSWTRTLAPFLVVLPLAALAPKKPAVAAESNLFADHEPLMIELAIDMKSLCRDDDDTDCDASPARLVHHTRDGTPQTMAVQVRSRGQWRRDPDHCAMPPLFLFFNGSDNAGTTFAGQTMLPLTTHCKKSPRKYEQYLLKEYLAYRIYNLLSEKSLRVRLARITYHDTSRRARTVERYGFFTEHFQSLAARHNAVVWQPEQFDPLITSPMELAILGVFQYLIGNTDWSIIYRHNIMTTRTSSGAVTPVPFDLDFSGLVNAAYAGPPPKLPIRSVRQRLFRGFCRSDTDWDRVFAHFERRGDAVLALVDQVPDLQPSTQKSVTAYLEKFYKLLESDRRRQKKIIGACRPLQSS